MTGNLPQRQPVDPLEIGAAPLLVDVVVLSADLALFEATRNAVGERNPVWRARSAAESVDLLLSGRCGVLLLDLAAVSAEPASLIEQIVEQFPDVIVIVAGRREDEPLLGRLLSEGHVYRFMHKPLSPKRAGMFLDAAMRGHVERRGLRTSLHATSGAPVRSGHRFRKWLFVAGGLACFLALLALVRTDRATPPEATPVMQPPATTIDTRADGGPKADPVLSRARAALASGRLEAPPGRNALDLYAAVLLARPEHREARAGLTRTREAIVELATREAAEGRPAEARRLLQRVMAVDPGDPAVVALARQLAPVIKPATPEPEPVMAVMPVAPIPRPTGVRTEPPRPAETRVSKPVPDPLTPRVVNADALRRPLRRSAGPRVFGSPIQTHHVVAGDAAPLPEGTTSPEPALDASSTMTPTLTGGVPPSAPSALPADEFRPLVMVDPDYPPAALRSRTTGWVELAFTITESGTVRDIEVVRAEPGGVFDVAASTALGRWQFEPRFVNGRPVPHRSVVTLRFNVDD